MRSLKPIFLMSFTVSFNVLAGPALLVTKVELENGATEVMVENKNYGSVSAVMWAEAENTYSDIQLPSRFVLKPFEKRKAFTLAPSVRSKPSKFTVYTTTMFGNANADHTIRTTYQLPFVNETSRVTQTFGDGHNTTHSILKTPHAVDFALPERSTVVAARDGVVIAMKLDSSIGGDDPKLQNDANYVYIEHQDGTVAKYLHLYKGVNYVRIGDQVKAGEPIALSGNTGFSSAPHLHFEIFKPIYAAKSILESESLPVLFSQGVSVFRAKTGNIVSSSNTKQSNERGE